MMNNLGYEAKKILTYRRGLFIIIVFAILYVVAMVIVKHPSNIQTIHYSDEYNNYLAIVDGKLTTEKQAYLELESNKISQSKILIDKLYEDYYSGEISDNEFLLKSTEYESILHYENGFDEIFDQYIYVREDPDKRYFLDTNGWNSLLVQNNMDFIMILCLFLLIIPIFCYEYGNKMNTIIVTTKIGQGDSNYKKISLACLIPFIFGVISCFMNFLFCVFKYGIECGNYPIQSLEFFSTSTRNISLLTAFFTISAIKIFGLIFLSLMILAISTLLKKATMSIFLITLITILPHLTMSDNTRSFLPLPTTLILNSFLFQGEIKEYDSLTKETLTVFNEVSPNQLFSLLASACILCVIFVFIVIINNRNKHRIKKICRYSKTQVTSLLLMSTLFLTSCTPISETINVTYNTDDRGFYNTNKYSFYINSRENFMPMFVDNTGEIQNLMRTPLTENISSDRALYGHGNYVYYIYYTLDKSTSRGEARNKVAFVKVNIDTFEETVIFEKELENKSIVDNSQWEFLHSMSSFFISNDDIFISSNDFYRINTRKTSVEILDIPTNSNVAFDGDYIYYIGEKSALFRYDILNDTHREFADVITSQFYLTEASIIFINRKDENKLYEINKDGRNLVMLCDKNISYFTNDSETIIVIDKNGKESVINHE